MPYAFSRTISNVLCTFKRFQNFNFHQSARWVYLGPGVKVGSLFWSARSILTLNVLKSTLYVIDAICENLICNACLISER